MFIGAFVLARGICLLALAGIGLGCDGQSPAGPSPPPTTGVLSVAAPSIAALTPNAGSTGGGTAVRITGSGFQSGATVTLDGERRNATVDGSAVLHFTTQAHDAGVVDVVVTNPGDQAVRLTGAYTYAPPQSFDFNGTWVGYAMAHADAETQVGIFHADMDLRLVIQDNRLIGAMCGDAASTFSQPASVSNGEFLAVADDGGALSGRIVSAVSAIGTITTAACPTTRWAATRY